MANENEVIGWDDEVSDEGLGNGNAQQDELVLLEPGQYRFAIAKVEKGRYNGGTNIPACGMVKVGIVLHAGDGRRGFASTRFYMVKKRLWSIYRFLESIGLHKPGEEQSVIPWNKVDKGLEGICSVKIHEWNGKQYNEVNTWIPKADDTEDGDY